MDPPTVSKTRFGRWLILVTSLSILVWLFVKLQPEMYQKINRRRFPMKRHRFLVGFAVLFVSLLVTTKAPAKESNFDAGQHNASKGVVFMNHEEFLRIAKSIGLKVRLVKFVKLSKHDLEKLGKLSSKGCGCAVPEDEAFTLEGTSSVTTARSSPPVKPLVAELLKV